MHSLAKLCVLVQNCTGGKRWQLFLICKKVLFWDCNFDGENVGSSNENVQVNTRKSQDLAEDDKVPRSSSV